MTEVLPSDRRVTATARRRLAIWCASEGRCLCKIFFNQWKTLIEGLNGPSVKAFICFAKFSISSRMLTVKETISKSKTVFTCYRSRFMTKYKVTYSGSFHRPQQLLPEIQQMHQQQKVLYAKSWVHNLASTGQPLTGRWQGIRIQRRRWTEELLYTDNWIHLEPFLNAVNYQLKCFQS